jgi:hypothetical protein
MMPGLTQVGDLLQSRYAIERELGRGGMAALLRPARATEASQGH